MCGSNGLGGVEEYEHGKQYSSLSSSTDYVGQIAGDKVGMSLIRHLISLPIMGMLPIPSDTTWHIHYLPMAPVLLALLFSLLHCQLVKWKSLRSNTTICLHLLPHNLLCTFFSTQPNTHSFNLTLLVLLVPSQPIMLIGYVYYHIISLPLSKMLH